MEQSPRDEMDALLNSLVPFAEKLLVDYGEFGNDAHMLFALPQGREIWEPEVTAFLKELGLPYEPAGK